MLKDQVKKDYCHLFYYLKYPRQVGIQALQEGLTPEEKSLLQKGPKFAVTLAIIPVKEYISTATVVTPGR